MLPLEMAVGGRMTSSLLVTLSDKSVLVMRTDQPWVQRLRLNNLPPLLALKPEFLALEGLETIGIV